MTLHPRVVTAAARGGFRVHLGFTDGSKATVDLAPWVAGKGGVFGPLQNEAFFSQVAVDVDAGTICWPNGADFDPDVLYEAAING
ncbi:MAG: DUF2442 domain-containing protein [Gemmatimonadales bacterium]|jgi:hypothetical protein|nr:DUF2442 domain-containing protein [Gemmatimonadales bacterium]